MTKEREELLKALSSVELLTLCIWGEARGEPVLGKIAVGCVVRNRVMDKKLRWSKSVREVILQPKQFSCFNEGDPNLDKIVKMAEMGSNRLSDPNVKESMWAAHGIMYDWLQDVTKGANHYFAVSIDPPDWADPKQETVVIGHHKFFKL